MIQRLDAEGLVKYEKYRGMVLTSAGEEVAARIAHRHELLTTFLRQLGLSEAVISQDVEGLSIASALRRSPRSKDSPVLLGRQSQRHGQNQALVGASAQVVRPANA